MTKGGKGERSPYEFHRSLFVTLLMIQPRPKMILQLFRSKDNKSYKEFESLLFCRLSKMFYFAMNINDCRCEQYPESNEGSMILVHLLQQSGQLKHVGLT